MMNDSSKLLLLPGLGADDRLFRYQIDNLSNVEVPEWIPFKDGETLQEYCERFAQTIKVGAQDFIGGMSFGGQVALELAKHLECAGCFLISANRSSKEIGAQFRMQNSLLKTLPENFVRTGLKNIAIPKLISWETLDETEATWLQEMVDDMDFDFFKWSSNAAASWKYDFNPSDFKTPIKQIHGEHDSIIKIEPADHVTFLKGAGHLINYTHASELNKWLKTQMQTPVPA